MIYLSLGSPESKAGGKGLCALRLSMSAIPTNTGERQGEKGNERAIWCIRCDDCLLSMEPSSKIPCKWLLLGIVHRGRMVKNFSAPSISQDPSFASWDINSSSTYRLHVCGCRWVPQSVIQWSPVAGSEDGRHRHERKSWWIVTPSSWSQSMKNGPLAARSKILVTGET